MKARSYSIADKNRHVRDVGFSPDGRKLAFVESVNGRGQDNPTRYVVRVWDIGSGTSLQLPGHPNARFPHRKHLVFAFSPDGQSLAYHIKNGAIQIVSANDGTIIKQLRYELKAIPDTRNELKGIPDTMRFSADGRKIAAAGDNWLRVWEVGSGKVLVSANAVYTFSPAAQQRRKKSFSPWFTKYNWPDQLRWKWENLSTNQVAHYIQKRPLGRDGVVFSSGLSKVAFWLGNRAWVRELSTGRVLREIERDNDVISDVAFSRDGKRIALETKAYENAIRLVEIATGKVEASFRGHGMMASDISFSTDGSKLLATTWYRIYVWDVKTRKLLPYLDGHEVVTNVGFSPDGRFVASEGLDQVTWGGGGGLVAPKVGDGVRVWDARTGKERFNFGPCHGLLFTPDSKTLLTWKNDGLIDVRDLQSGKTVQSFRLKAWYGKSPKTRFNPLHRELLPADFVWDVDITADGGTLVYLFGGQKFAFADRQKPRIAFFDRRQKNFRFLPPNNVDNNYSPRLESLTISSDGTKLLCIHHDDQDNLGMSGTFVILDSETGKPEVRYKPKNRRSVEAVVFSPDAKLVAAWCSPDHVDDGPTQIHIVEAETGRLLRSIIVPLRYHFLFVPRFLAFSPDSRLLAVGGHAANVLLWDVKSGRKLSELVGHLGEVTSLAFSKDGRMLASGSIDSTVLVWDIRKVMQ